MQNTHLSPRLRSFERKPNPPAHAARPIYQVNLHRQRPRPPRPEPRLGLLDAAAGKLGRPGRMIAGCFGVFFSLVIMAFLSALGLFGFAAFTILSNF